MKISNYGLDIIKQFEGCRLHAYKCPAGVWTIGYGHTGDVRSGDVITKEKADELLIQDLKRFELHVMSYNHLYCFNQNEFDALVSFAYNVGNINGLTANGTRNRLDILKYLLKYNKGGGKILPGLIKRRQMEHDLFCKSTMTKSNENIADEIIAGLWGNGKTRKQNVIDAGYDYEAIRKIVNKKMKQLSKK